jgi:hypothetical protein
MNFFIQAGIVWIIIIDNLKASLSHKREGRSILKGLSQHVNHHYRRSGRRYKYFTTCKNMETCGLYYKHILTIISDDRK